MGYETYWTHGLATVAERPWEAGFTEKRPGWAYEVTQQAGTGNWFHIPLVGHGGGDRHADVYLQVEVDNGATITNVAVWGKFKPGDVGDEAEPLGAWHENITGQRDQFSWNLPDNEIKYGLVLCVGVSFDGGGTVKIYGAGLRHMT